MTAIALFALTLAASAVLVGFIRRWAVRKAILDHPNERSSHDVPTPRGGGIAIVLVTLAGSAYWITPFSSIPDINRVRAAVLAAAALLIAAVSFADDLRHLPATLRLGAHIVAALAVALLFAPLVWVPVAVVWIVGLTNAYNFMDGIDGIAGGQAVVAGLAWAWLGAETGEPLVTAIGLLIAGSSAGFLLYNWQPARIFMGDVGSAFLGFTFASLAVIGGRANPRLAVAGALVVWPFVADAAFTFFRRARRRERLMEAHKSHVYQRLNQTGLSHAAVTATYIALAAAGAAGAVAFMRGVPLGWIGAALSLLALGVWGWAVGRERGTG